MATILIVDDSELARSDLRRVIEDAGYGIVEASDGKVALQVLETTSVDLIIADVNMPELDGLNMARHIRASEHTAGDGHRIPIIMLTTEGRSAQVSEGRDIGIDGWIVKPCKPKQLLQGIERLVKRSTKAS